MKKCFGRLRYTLESTINRKLVIVMTQLMSCGLEKIRVFKQKTNNK